MPSQDPLPHRRDERHDERHDDPWLAAWLRDGPDGVPDRSIEGPNRPPAGDRAECLIRRPGPWSTAGPVGDQIRARRRQALRSLAETEGELARLFRRRRLLVERVDRCTVALAGTGSVRDATSGRAQRLRYRRLERDPDVDLELDPDLELGTDPAVEYGPILSGRALRQLAVDLVLVVGHPIDLTELARLIGIKGLDIAPPSSHTLSNALRAAVSNGSIVRVGRGWYGPPGWLHHPDRRPI